MHYNNPVTKKEMKLKAEGITCLACATDMENILRNTDGILDASVHYDSELINLIYNPEILDRKKAFLAVRKLGYKLEIISESDKKQQ